MKKVLFYLTFLLTTIGGGNSAWADTGTVVFDYSDGGLLKTNLTSNVTHGSTKTITSGPVSLTFIAAAARSVNTNLDEGFVKFEGKSGENTGSSLRVSSSSNYQITSITFTSNKTGFVKNFTASTGTYAPVSSATTGTWSGSADEITFDTELGNVDQLTSISVTYSYVVNQFSGSYPYTWDFTKWETTSAALSDDTNWDTGETTVSYKTSLSSGAALELGGGELPETKGLVFTTTPSSRIVAYPDHYLQMYVTSITVPSLKTGYKVTFVTNTVGGNTSQANIQVSSSDINRETVNGKYVFTYEVPSDGSVTFDVKAMEGNPLQILSISVEKADFAFSEHHTEYWDGATSTNTKSGTYKARTTNFSVRANVPAGASVSKENFTVNSSSDAIDVSNWGFSNSNLASGEIWFNNLIVNKSGVAELTFTYAPKENDDYNPASFTVLVNVVKGNIPYFQFTYNDKNKDERAFSPSPINKTMKYETSEDRLPQFDDVTFTSSNTEVATVDSSTGVITFVKPGISVITATFAGNDRYYGAETYFTLVVTGTENTGTINWTPTIHSPSTPPSPSDGKITLKLGDHAIKYPATSSLGGEVKYMSTDNDIVTVNASGAIEAKHPGVAYIYAYQEGSEGQSWIYKDYKVQVNGGSISIGFEPGSATITKDRILMPRLSIPSLEKADITSLTLTVQSGGESYVSVSPNLLLDEFLEMQGYTIAKVHPRITGLAATSSPVKVTAHFVSPYYNNGEELTADFLVTVTDNTGNFSWATQKTEFTIVEGEFMMMPSITGNANGNIDGLSKGSVNQARQGYVYEIKGSNRSITYNTEDYYYGQGVPDYTLTPAAVGGGQAYIYWIKGMDDSHPALMIYGESAGDLTLTATDSQTGYSPGNITIHVVSKDDNVKTAETNFWNNKKFPFTWDFTNIASADITDDEVHWKTKYYGDVSSNAMDLVTDAESGCHLLGMASSFDYNYSDEQDTDNLIAKNKSGDGKDPQTIAKYICNGEGSDCKVMPAFHGIRIALGNNSHGRFHHKRDKVKLFDTSTKDPRLYLEGGKHYLYLPAVGSSKTPGTAYKLFMKVKGHTLTLKNNSEVDKGNSSHVDVDVLSEDNGNPSTTTIASEYVITKDVKSIISFDIPAEHAGKAVRLGFDKNVDIYWIAFSTEAKTLAKFNNTSRWASTYSYTKDLDLSKSHEAFPNVTAYYASEFSGQNEVKVSEVTNNAVPRETGLLLKAETNPGSTYFIANAENVSAYSAPSAISGTNYLVANPAVGTKINANTTIGDNQYTNFTLAYRYKVVHADGHIDSDYTLADDWSFYRIAPSGMTVSNKNLAYLQVPGDLYVYTNRRAGDAEGNPASQELLKIVFNDANASETTDVNVNTVTERTADNEVWYTLQGVRVSVPTKGGIYIHKGKKVVVK